MQTLKPGPDTQSALSSLGAYIARLNSGAIKADKKLATHWHDSLMWSAKHLFKTRSKYYLDYAKEVRADFDTLQSIGPQHPLYPYLLEKLKAKIIALYTALMKVLTKSKAKTRVKSRTAPVLAQGEVSAILLARKTGLLAAKKAAEDYIAQFEKASLAPNQSDIYQYLQKKKELAVIEQRLTLVG